MSNEPRKPTADFPPLGWEGLSTWEENPDASDWIATRRSGAAPIEWCYFGGGKGWSNPNPIWPALVAPAPGESWPDEPDDDGWLPIEGAPRDGSPVDLWTSGGRLPDCHFGAGRWHGCNGWPIVDRPTHYRPIPKGPGEK